MSVHISLIIIVYLINNSIYVIDGARTQHVQLTKQKGPIPTPLLRSYRFQSSLPYHILWLIDEILFCDYGLNHVIF